MNPTESVLSSIVLPLENIWTIRANDKIKFAKSP